MSEGIVFIQEPPVVTLDASGATLEYRSGGETYMRRYPRHLWRRVLESELMRLDEWEDADRLGRHVVDMGRRAKH